MMNMPSVLVDRIQLMCNICIHYDMIIDNAFISNPIVLKARHLETEMLPISGLSTSNCVAQVSAKPFHS